MYLAEQQWPVKRRVALKVIKPGMETREVIARLEAERQALALMDHPNIAKVYDAGATASGRPFFVMELVAGVPITDYCDQCQLSLRERLVLFVTVCQAVQHAHQKGVIHRDLKPSNVLVAIQDGRPAPKIIDFGIAKALNQRLTERTFATGFTQMIGTPLYMSPEQAELSPLGADARSDIYSLGVLLYELLTGTTPFEKKRLLASSYDEVRRIIREEEPPCPSARIDTLPVALASTVAERRRSEPRRLGQIVRGELDWVVMKCLEKDRSRRYESASSLARDLERFLRNEPVSACPPSLGYRMRKFVRRNRWPVITTLLVATLLVAGTVISTWLAVWAVKSEKQIHRLLAAETAARNDANRQRDQAEQTLLDALSAQARAARWSRRSGQRYESLTALSEAAELASKRGVGDDTFLKLRNEAIACLALVDARFPDRWLDLPADMAFIVYDPQLKRFARSDPKEGVNLFSAEDGRRLYNLPRQQGGKNGHLRFSPDGEFLAITYGLADGSVSLDVWHLGKRQLTLSGIPFLYSHRNGCLAFSSDSKHLAVIEPGDTIAIYDLHRGERARQFVVLGDHLPTGVAINCDGTRLAVRNGPEILILDMETGELQQTLPQPDGVWFLTWHPHDPDVLAACRFAIYIWDISKGEQLTLSGHTAEVVDLAFSHRGDLLASRGWDNTIRLWNPWTGKELVSSPGAYTNCYLQFSPDDRQLAFVSDGQRFGPLELAPPRVYRPLQGMTGQGRGNVAECDISSNGNLLAAGFNYHPPDEWRVWDLASGRCLASFETSVGIFAAAFDPFGAGVYTSGDAGLQYWPIEFRPADGAGVRVGPPRSTGLTGELRGLAVSSRAGRMAIVRRFSEAIVVDLPRAPSEKVHGEERSRLHPVQLDAALRLPHPRVSNVTMTQDGRLVATGTWHGNEVRIWDGVTGECLKELTGHRSALVAFSPNGRWLATSTGQEVCLYEVGSWQVRYRRQRDHFGDVILDVAFSPDSKLLAAAANRTQVELIAPEMGRLLAVLEAPDTYGGTALQFTSDGTQLVVQGSEVRASHVWDLKLLRQNLAAMGLDLDLPPFPGGP